MAQDPVCVLPGSKMIGSTTMYTEPGISADGKTTCYSPQALAQVNAGLPLIKGLEGLQHWDQLGDMGRVTSLINLATEARLARAKASLRILAGRDTGTTQSMRAANDGFFRSAA